MEPFELIGIAAGVLLLCIFLFRSSKRQGSRKMLRMDMESENSHLRQIVAQMSIDRHVAGRRR